MRLNAPVMILATCLLGAFASPVPGHVRGLSDPQHERDLRLTLLPIVPSQEGDHKDATKMGTSTILGGLSQPYPATPNKVQGLVESVEFQFEEHTKNQYDVFKAIEYKTQVVAGINYFDKVQTGATDYATLKIFQSYAGNNPVLTGFQTGQDKSDEIKGF